MRGLIVDRAMMLIAVAGLALPVSGQVARNHTPITSETNVGAVKTPYTAEYKVTHVQTLADGTTITRDSTEVRASDSHGRSMIARTTTSGDRAPITHVVVFDPVARTQITWLSPGKIARVFKMSAPDAAEHNCSGIMRNDATVVSGPKSKFTSENLGTESIQGIEARGRRRTTTIPEGVDGNDAPLVITSEMWSAVAVVKGLMLRENRDDPRSGKMTEELTSLSQSDPDPTTFQPPEGYEIVTKDSFVCQEETTAATSK
jgi:hypothetical protein